MESILNYTEEHKMYREAYGKFLDKEVVPYYEEWEKNQLVPPAIWKRFGDQGYLCHQLSEEYGGVEADFLYAVIDIQELGYRGLNGVFTPLHSHIIVPYIAAYGTEEQKQRWLPGCASGDLLTAVAMTEPGAGSDLAAMKTKAVKDGDYYVLNGSKTFISNAINASLFIVAAKTDPMAKAGGVSLFVVEKGTPGFETGKALQKVGVHAQDTAELFFDNCRVPKENLLGKENKGFYYLMDKLQQERLIAAIGAIGKSKRAWTLPTIRKRERIVWQKP